VGIKGLTPAYAEGILAPSAGHVVLPRVFKLAITPAFNPKAGPREIVLIRSCTNGNELYELTAVVNDVGTVIP
jgi:hypothetical protein